MGGIIFPKMIEIGIYSVFAFFILWFFGLRYVLKKRKIYSTGADFFQAFMKDILAGINLAKSGDQLALLVILSMLLCLLVFFIVIIFQ